MDPGWVLQLLQQRWHGGGEAGEALAQVPDRIAVQVVAAAAVVEADLDRPVPAIQ